MRYSKIAFVVCVCFAQFSNADSLFDNPRLDTFVADLTDKNTTRHYALVSKQSAIHKWFIRDCMSDLGLHNEANTAPHTWQQALYGEYAYCQDHHIPSIDPPCPTEDVVELSVNNACFHSSMKTIDWSHDIMHIARRNMPDNWRTDPSDPAIKAIESDWSICMVSDGYIYKSRTEMYQSFGAAADFSLEVQATLPSKTEVMRSAERCFTTTDYYNKRSLLTDAHRKLFFLREQNKLELALKRYETAELQADDMISQLCSVDRDAIISMYKQDSYTDTYVCEASGDSF